MKLQIVPVIDRYGVRYQVKQLGFFNRGKWLCFHMMNKSQMTITKPDTFLSYMLIKRFRSVSEATKTIDKLYGHTGFTLDEWVGK